MQNHFHYFSTQELGLMQKYQTTRDRLFKIFVQPLFFLKISPNLITLLSFICILIFAYYVVISPKVALTFLIMHILLDGIDGTLARLSKKTSTVSSLIDILNDHTSMVVVVGALLVHKFLNPAWGLAYVYVYSVLIVLLLYSNTQGIAPRLTLRTKYFLYLLYGLWALFKIDYIQQGVAFFTIITLLFSIVLFRRIITSLEKKEIAHQRNHKIE